MLADALVYYRYENLRFGLNVDNIFDETYYERSYNAFWVGVCQRAPKSPQLWAFKIPWPAGSVRIGDQPAV
ncbi:hypothetical protein [Methylorubrum aminovorans]|uniref:hypothetical protein n=1 Tax=Methylorubrum aminovorans TaxID=269069 RepID=UPI0032AFD504